MRSTLFAAFVLLTVPAARPCDTAHGVPVGPPHYAPACDFSVAALAANDHGAFSAWRSTHGGFGLTIGEDFGMPLDPQGRPLAPAQTSLGGGTANPLVATDGSDFLLLHYTNGFASARKISEDGAVIGPSVVITSAGSLGGNTNGSGNIFWSGSEYTILLTAAIADDEIHGIFHGRIIEASVSRDGEVREVHALLDGATLVAAVSSAPGRILMIWLRGGVIEAGTLDGSSLTSTPERLDGIPSTVGIALATDGTGFLAVWHEQSGRIAGLRLDADGSPSGPLIEIARTEPVVGRSDPLAVWDGSSYAVFWSENNSTNAARISSSGIPISAAAIQADGRPAAATATSRGILLLTIHGCGSIASIAIDRGALTAAAARTDISIAVVPQSFPHMAATPRGHQLLWTEGGNLVTRFLGSDGSFGDSRQLNDSPLANAADPGLVSSIVAFHGGAYIVWAEGPANGAAVLRAQRFDAAGQFVGAKATIDSLFSVLNIALAESGDELFLVSEEQDLRAFSGPEVYAARLDGDGNLLQRVAVAAPDAQLRSIVASADGVHALAGWLDGLHELHAATLDAADLRVQRLTIISLPVDSAAFLLDIRQAPSAAAFWLEASSVPLLHMTLLDSQLDVVMTEVRDDVLDARRDGNDLYWVELHPHATIVSARLTASGAGPPLERACFTIDPFPFAYAVRDGVPSAIVYADGPQLRVQGLAPSRRRPSRR